MAKIDCVFSGYTYYNANNWARKSFTNTNGYGYPGFGRSPAGNNRCIVLRFVTPSLSDAYTDRKLSIKIPLARSSAAGNGSDVFRYRVTTEPPTFSETSGSQITFPTSYICSGSQTISLQTALNGYSVKTINTGVADFESDSTYYIWLWSDTPFSYTSNLEGYFGNHSDVGLISVGMEYTLVPLSTLTVTDGVLGVSQTIAVTQADSSMTHTIEYICGTASGFVVQNSSATSISWTPDLTLAKQNTTGLYVSVSLTITTYSGGTNLGTNTYSIKCYIPDTVRPVLKWTIDDALGYDDRYGGYVKTLSRLNIKVTPELAYDSPISSYKVTVGDEVHTTSEFTTSMLKSAGSCPITFRVVDQRGRVSEATETLTVMDYNPPAITQLAVHRCAADGTEDINGAYLKATFSANVTPLNNANGAEYFLYYKKTSEVEFNGVALDGLYNQRTVVDYEYVFPADTTYSYDIEVVVEDNHFGVKRAAKASTGFALMSWKADGTAMAVGKISNKSNSFEVGLTMYDKYDTLMGNGLAAYGSASEGGIDPDTTLESLVLTSLNTPKSGTFFYITTYFYNSKSVTSARTQVAYPYNAESSLYLRYYKSGTWSDWDKYMTQSESLLAVYPVNSIYISYSHTSPASLFGGTWTRLAPYFLYGTGETGTIGETGGSTSHTLTVDEMPAHTHLLKLRANAGTETGYSVMQENGKYSLGTRNENTGGGQAFSIIPPFIKVSIWRRTA